MKHAKTAVGIILAALWLEACGAKSSKDSPDTDTGIETRPQVVGGPQSEAQNPLPTQPLPAKPMTVMPLKERSSELFCKALMEFFQNYAATRLQGTTASLIMETNTACREDSYPTNLGLHTALLLSKGQNQLRLAVNIVAHFEGDRFVTTNVLVDRLSQSPAMFVAGEGDKVFGDMSLFTSDLKTFAELKNAPFRIHGLVASQAYRKVESNFKPGNRRNFMSTPKLAGDLSASTKSLRIREVAAEYFGPEKTFLRCDKLSCLSEGLSYDFQGTDLILYSKPFVGAENESRKASFKIKLTSALLD